MNFIFGLLSSSCTLKKINDLGKLTRLRKLEYTEKIELRFARAASIGLAACLGWRSTPSYRLGHAWLAPWSSAPSQSGAWGAPVLTDFSNPSPGCFGPRQSVESYLSANWFGFWSWGSICQGKRSQLTGQGYLPRSFWFGEVQTLVLERPRFAWCLRTKLSSGSF